MARAFALITFLASVALLTHGAEPNLQQRYLNTYLQINNADQIEKGSDIRHAYALYSKSFQELILMNFIDPDILGESPLANDIEHKLSALKTRILNQQMPSPTDMSDREFAADLAADILGWKKIQGDHPAFEPKLIATRISDDASILDYLKKH